MTQNYHKRIEILLVEDNEGDVFLITDALAQTKLGHRVHVASNGEVALEMLKGEKKHADFDVPDLMILDINLPKINGKQLLEEVKQDNELRQIPIIILTSSSYKQDVIDCYKSYASSYIVKPHHSEDFKEIANAIERFWFDVVVLPRQVYE